MWPRLWPGAGPLPSHRVPSRFTEEPRVTNHVEPHRAQTSILKYQEKSSLLGARQWRVYWSAINPLNNGKLTMSRMRMPSLAKILSPR